MEPVKNRKQLTPKEREALARILKVGGPAGKMKPYPYDMMQDMRFIGTRG